MLEVRTEKVSYSVNEKKTINPTMKMLEFALANAGFKEGVWLLRSPHRTRKKGAERFRAMRLDGTGIRVRCKPGGNDTCYEWTLFPPAGMDQDSVFSDLCALHPNSMRSTKTKMKTEEVSILGGLFDRISMGKPSAITQDMVAAPLIKLERVIQDDQDSGDQEIPEESPQDSANPKEVAEEVEPPMTRIGSLDISATKYPLSSNFAMDRALLAFWMSSRGSDFVRRNVLSDMLIDSLNMVGLSKRSPIYGSVKGAMRALLMACCSAGYMERLMYGENSTNGYRLTDSGKKRLDFLKSLLDDPVAERFKKATERPSPKIQQAPSPPAGSERADDTISRLKGLIDEHEAVKKEMEELRQLTEELEGEGEDDDLMLSGLDKTLGEKIAERDALNREIGRLEAKLGSLKAAKEKKASDMGSLKEDMERLSERKREIESKLTAR